MATPKLRFMTLLLTTTLFVGGCTSQADNDEATGSDDALTLKPNGTANMATVVLAAPPGFTEELGPTKLGPYGRWTFDTYVKNQTVPVKLGTPVRVSAGPQSIRATFSTSFDRLTWTPWATEDLGSFQAQPGIVTTFQFGAVRLLNLPTTAMGSDIAIALQDTSIYPRVVENSDDLRGFYYAAYAQPSPSNPDLRKDFWWFGSSAVPMPQGSYELDFGLSSTPIASRAPNKRFAVQLGKTTDVDASIPAPIAPFVITFSRNDAVTMPDAEPQLKIEVECKPWWAGADYSEAMATIGKPFRIYTGTAKTQWRYHLSGGPSPWFDVASGGKLDAKVARIEVDDVVLSDAAPSVTVPGTWSIRQGGVPLGDNLPTKRGIDVMPGKSYTITVNYKTPLGAPQTVTYNVTP